jgi:hypothetical protein
VDVPATGKVLWGHQEAQPGDRTRQYRLNGLEHKKNDASTSDKFFLLRTSSTQIVTTFNQIGTQLANLYLAR